MNESTRLLRQVNPSWIRDSAPTSQAFRPTPKDHSKLSVYDGDLISPEDSWKHFCNILGLVSVGTLAVSVQECARVELTVESDPEPFPEHAIIDFSGQSKTQITKTSKRLREAAVRRGWLYRPDGSN